MYWQEPMRHRRPLVTIFDRRFIGLGVQINLVYHEKKEKECLKHFCAGPKPRTWAEQSTKAQYEANKRASLP